MADQSHYIEIVLDDKGAIKKLGEVDAKTRGLKGAGEEGAKGMTALEAAMRRASAAGTLIGNMAKDAIYRGFNLVTDVLKQAVSASAEYQKAMTGLGTVAGAFGITQRDAAAAARALSQDGLIPLKDSAEALKNLLSTGFKLDEANQLLKTFKDSAAFGAQGMLSMGDAVVRATQGIKFGNSALTDSTGLGKNLSVIMKEAGLAESRMGMAASDAAVRQAILNGFLREGAMFAGDADKKAATYSGQLDRLKTGYNELLVTIGDYITTNATVAALLGAVSGALDDTKTALGENNTAHNLITSTIVGTVRALSLLVTGLDYAQKAFYGLRWVLEGTVWLLAEGQKKILGFVKTTLDAAKAVPGSDALFPGISAAVATVTASYDSVSALAYQFGLAMDETNKKMTDNSTALTGWAEKLDAVATRLEATRGQVVEVGESKLRPPQTPPAGGADKGEIAKLVKSWTELAAAITRAEVAGASGEEIQKRYADELRKGASAVDFFRIAADKVPPVLQRWFKVQQITDFMDALQKATLVANEIAQKAASEAAAAGSKQNVAMLSATAASQERLTALYWQDREAKAVTEKDKLQLTIDRLTFEEAETLASLNRQSALYETERDAVQQHYAQMRANAQRAFALIGDDAKSLGAQIMTSFGEWTAKLPQLLEQAFTGGGGSAGFGKAAASSFGSMIGGNLITNGLGSLAAKFSGQLASTFGVGFTQALGAALPGIGSALGALATTLVGKLFGPSKGALLGKQADASIAELQAKLLKTYGSLEGIVKAGGAAGEALAAAWGSKNQAGLAHFTQLVDEFTQAVEDQKQAEKELAEQISSTQKELADKQRDLNKLLEDRAGDGLASTKQMTEAAAKYGIEIDALGQRYQQLATTEMAAALLGDFQMLTQGGTEAGVVLTGMKDSITTLVKHAVKFGTVIPENFKPLIDNLIESNQLVDENGKALEGLATLKFGTAIKTEWEKVSDEIANLASAIETLSATLARLLPQAVESAADEVNHALDGIDFESVAYRGVKAFESIEDAATGAAWGHSPTGIKEIPIATEEALAKIKEFGAYASQTFTSLESMAGAYAGLTVASADELGKSIQTLSYALQDLTATPLQKALNAIDRDLIQTLSGMEKYQNDPRYAMAADLARKVADLKGAQAVAEQRKKDADAATANTPKVNTALIRFQDWLATPEAQQWMASHPATPTPASAADAYLAGRRTGGWTPLTPTLNEAPKFEVVIRNTVELDGDALTDAVVRRMPRRVKAAGV